MRRARRPSRARGIPLRIVDLGVSEDPRYVFREVLPIGTEDQRRLRWNVGTDRWIAGADDTPPQARPHPYFILTRSPSPSQVADAMAFFLADRQADQSAQVFGVADRSGSGIGLIFEQAHEHNVGNNVGGNVISRVWPDGGPAPFWWSLYPAEAYDHREWGVMYAVGNEGGVFDVLMAWSDDTEFDDADFASAGMTNDGTIPAAAGGVAENAYLAIWVAVPKHGVRQVSNPFYTPWTWLLTERTLNGVDGFWMRTSELIERASTEGAAFTVELNAALRRPVQPPVTAAYGVVEINGVLHDATIGQLFGDRPQTQESRISPASPWALAELVFTRLSESGDDVQLPEMLQYRTRVARDAPAMYVGWNPGTAETPPDFDSLQGSQTLQIIMPQTDLGKASVVIWVDESQAWRSRLLPRAIRVTGG